MSTIQKEIISNHLNQPAGVFSHGSRIPMVDHDLVFASGLTSRGLDGSVVGVGDVGKQTEHILDNLKILLNECGGGLDTVVRLTVYVRNMRDFKPIHAVRKRYFTTPLPASTMVEVSQLVDPNHLIEIEAIACIPHTTEDSRAELNED